MKRDKSRNDIALSKKKIPGTERIRMKKERIKRGGEEERKGRKRRREEERKRLLGIKSLLEGSMNGKALSCSE